MEYANKNIFNKSNGGNFTSIDSVKLWITSLAQTVGVDDWKSDMNFTQCGGDSFQLVRIINLIDESLGTKVK